MQLLSRINLDWLSRFAIALVYVWFGLLKLVGQSPAEPAVSDLFNVTIGSLVPFGLFYMSFALFEVAIGVGFIIPKITRWVYLVFGLHMFSTLLPLVAVPTSTWYSFLVPTLFGQYILKNVVLITLATRIYKDWTSKDF